MEFIFISDLESVKRSEYSAYPLQHSGKSEQKFRGSGKKKIKVVLLKDVRDNRVRVTQI